MSTQERFFEPPPVFAGNTNGRIYELIPLVMADIGGVAKTRKNEQQKYSFRGIEDFYLAAHPALITHGVFCAPKVLSRQEYRFDKTNDFGKTTTWLHVAVEVEHRFFASDGSFVAVTTWGEGLDNSDKATNKAMSGAMKYALIELFCVPTQDVEDADRTTPENGMKRRPSTAPVTEEDEIILPKSAAGNRPSGDGELEKRVSTPSPAAAEPHSTAVSFASPGLARTEAAPDKATAPQAAVEYIDMGRQKNLHIEWRKAIRKDFTGDKDFSFYDWLLANGYVDAQKVPTAGAIPMAEFDEVKRKMLQKARSL